MNYIADFKVVNGEVSRVVSVVENGQEKIIATFHGTTSMSACDAYCAFTAGVAHYAKYDPTTTLFDRNNGEYVVGNVAQLAG